MVIYALLLRDMESINDWIEFKLTFGQGVNELKHVAGSSTARALYAYGFSLCVTDSCFAPVYLWLFPLLPQSVLGSPFIFFFQTRYSPEVPDLIFHFVTIILQPLLFLESLLDLDLIVLKLSCGLNP